MLSRVRLVPAAIAALLAVTIVQPAWAVAPRQGRSKTAAAPAENRGHPGGGDPRAAAPVE